MSEEQPQAAEPKWGDDITAERQAVLDALAEQQRAWVEQPEQERGDSPCKGMQLTGAEVFHLAARALAGPGGDLSAASARLRDPAQPRPSALSALHLEGAYLRAAHLEKAHLVAAHLEGAVLYEAHLERASLTVAHLERADLRAAHLERASLTVAHLEGALLGAAHLEQTDFHKAHLSEAALWEAHLERADLRAAHLEGLIVSSDELARLHTWVPDFPAQLPPADLRLAFLNEATSLNNATLGTRQHGYVRVADVRWGGVNLAVVELPPAHLLSDERAAHATKGDKIDIIGGYQAAVRANRQFAIALQGLGLNEEAARYAYRAQFLQQQVLRRQRKFGAYLFSRFLDVLAGYGYRPLRGVIAYVLVIAGFAFAYGLATHGVLTFGLPPSQLQPLPWYEALVLSISSFHGRGFFQPVQSLGDPVAILASGEAIVGLFIEISFIATFTQRFFGSK
jgi:uncharacterized protein YjbI with pentapeptide repeats